MTAMPIYYINLASAPGRRAEMERQFAALGLVAERVEAVTPADISVEEMAAYCNPDRYRWLAPTELACSLSHIKVWREIVASGASRALVLEDDAVLSSRLPVFLDAFDHAGGDFGLVKIEICPDRIRTRPDPAYAIGEIQLRRVFGFSGGAAAYILSAETISRIIDRKALRHTSLDRGLFDSFTPLGRELAFLQADPGLAVQADQLDDDRKIEGSVLKPDLEIRQQFKHRSVARHRINAIRRWTNDNVAIGLQKSFLDLAGIKKRKLGFLP